jgi:hypothetical protein
MRLAASVAVMLFATPAVAVAETRLGAGYMMSLPVAGDSGGADHALSIHGERKLRSDIALGVALQAGYAPGNDDETLRRFAVMPLLRVQSEVAGAFSAGADVALGWQVLDGRTRLGDVPVAGTEPRSIRGEVAIFGEAPVSKRIAIRARAGLVIDAVFPASAQAATRLGPLVELGGVATF